MFIIRQALPQDLDDLYALARQTFFINLPPDREIIAAKIEQSTVSFRRLAGAKSPKTGAASGAGRRRSSGGLGRSGLRDITGNSDLFLLVLEDSHGNGGREGGRRALGKGGVVGTSQVIAHMGGPGHPRYFMTLDAVACQSRSLGLGWTHLVGRMGEDETGPTEIGGLILNQAFRGHPARLGRLLSFVRFQLIGLHRRHFAPKIVAEMLGPITRTGYNPFYEKFTRHFVTRAFADVYRFSQTSREFLATLIPKGDIYLSILDPEVANAAGEVGDDTRPARKMLERLGFEYHRRIDPLDGGPHLEASTGRLVPVRTTRRIRVIEAGGTSAGRGAGDLIVSVLDRNGEFRAVQTAGRIAGTRAVIERAAARALETESVVVAGATPMGP